jgi:hypothetical protein
MRFRKDGIDPMARLKAARDIFAALPGIWTKRRAEENSCATLPADRCHLDCAAVGVNCHDGDDAAIQEKYTVERTIGI